jgi:hypothetical protein
VSTLASSMKSYTLHQPHLKTDSFWTTYQAIRKSDNKTICLKVSHVINFEEQEKKPKKELLVSQD